MATPTNALSLDQFKRLTYSKYLLNRSRSLQRLGNDLATAEAVLVGHDAVEMVLRVVAEFRGARLPERVSFMDYWDRIEMATQKRPPDEDALRRFNRLRVDFKHFGILPHSGNAGDLLPVVGNFCHEIVKQHLSSDFDSVSLADLIPNDKAREQVKKAETAFDNGEEQEALAAMSLAFYALEAEASSKLGLAVDRLWKWGGVPSGWPNEVAEGIRMLDLDGLADTLQQLADATNSLALGISPQMLKRFQTMTPHVWRTGRGEPLVTWERPPQNLDKAEFESCRFFVVDFALRLATLR